MKKKGNIDEAILKVALGYQIAEVTEEYAESNGELKLVKRKKTKKDVPPDLKAVQLLLAETGGTGYALLSDEELELEKQRLMEELCLQTSAEEKGKKKKSTGTARKQKKENT